MKDLAIIIGVVQSPGPRMPELPKDASPLHVLAHEYACATYEDELAAQVLPLLQAVEAGCYKHVRVNMRDVNGNSLVVVGTIRSALSKAGVPELHTQVFLWQAMRGDYENLLRVCQQWVSIVDEPVEPTGDAIKAFRIRNLED